MSQHLSTTLLFVGCFLHLRRGHITPQSLAGLSALGIVVCASTTPALAHTLGSPSRPLAQPLSYALLCLVILALSPLLRTLTEATTSDSIVALSAALFLLSFALADYSCATPGNDDSTPPHLPATLSLNASLCAGIVLASRLDSPIQAFSLLLSSIFFFAFLPRWIRRHLPSQPHRPTLALVYTTAITLTSCALLAPFSLSAAVISVSVAAFLSIVCPAWMKRAQQWKVGRRGPWDVGVPRIRSK